MRLDSGLQPRRQEDVPVALTIGNFDGVHRGHAALLEEVAAAARRLGIEAALLTFDPHPRCVLDPGNCPPSLTVLEEKADLLQRHGVDRLVVLQFTPAVSAWSADEFCERLRQSFDLRALAVGHDFALGHKRQGDASFLRAWTARYGIEMHQVRPALDASGQPFSSTRIRRLVEGGEVGAAEALLGHPYVIDGTPVRADAQSAEGRLDLSVAPTKCLPAPGAYAAWLQDSPWKGAVLVVPDRHAAHPTVATTLVAHVIDGPVAPPASPVRVVVRDRLRADHQAVAGGGGAALREAALGILEASGPPTH